MTGSQDTPSKDTATPARPGWADALMALGSSFYAWLIRPRVRLTVTGAILVLVGGLMATTSVWTLPLVIAGTLMVAVAWMGHRLEGRFAIEWGEAGTQLAFNATIKAPAPALGAPPGQTGVPTAPAAPAPAAGAQAPPADVIEGEAHTVEINVGDLKALIAVAEAAEAPETEEADTAPGTGTSSVSDIRIRRLAEDEARTPRPAR